MAACQSVTWQITEQMSTDTIAEKYFKDWFGKSKLHAVDFRW